MIRDIILIQKRELESRLKEKYVERSVESIKLSRQGIFGYANFDDEKLIEQGFPHK